MTRDTARSRFGGVRALSTLARSPRLCPNWVVGPLPPTSMATDSWTSRSTCSGKPRFTAVSHGMLIILQRVHPLCEGPRLPLILVVSFGCGYFTYYQLHKHFGLLLLPYLAHT